MTIEQNDLRLTPYQMTGRPALPTSLGRWVEDEFRRLHQAIKELQAAALQATDTPPANPQRGMVRLAVLPWDPTGSGTAVLVWFNGSNWVPV
ncbi:hypothetical protein GAY31_11455 [Azospirillum brasilense]|nr:hypothetical protein [Azospirillum brasilense]